MSALRPESVACYLRPSLARADGCLRSTSSAMSGGVLAGAPDWDGYPTVRAGPLEEPDGDIAARWYGFANGILSESGFTGFWDFQDWVGGCVAERGLRCWSGGWRLGWRVWRWGIGLSESGFTGFWDFQDGGCGFRRSGGGRRMAAGLLWRFRAAALSVILCPP